VKQVVDLIFGENSTMKAFSETVLVQYPRKGIWSLGFVTGNTFSDVRDATGVEVVSVFIPTSPTPMTGFVINVPRSEAMKVDISIDQALRFIITAGVLTPEHVDAGEATRALPSCSAPTRRRSGRSRAENQKREDDDEGDDGSG
jgi:uncharacterized membrane protein